MSDALNCKVETRHDLLHKLQMSKKGTGGEHLIQKGTSALQRLLMLAVGLTEVIRPPGLRSTEGVSWPEEGCSLQRVFLSPDVTLDGRQRAENSQTQAPESSPHQAAPSPQGKSP